MHLFALCVDDLISELCNYGILNNGCHVLDLLVTPRLHCLYADDICFTTRLGASHTKSLEFSLVLLTNDRGTNFKALSFFKISLSSISLAAIFYVLICLLL